MRKPILATIALAAVTAAAALVALPYMNDARAGQTAQFTSAQRGAFAQAPAVMPLLSMPKPAVASTETAKPAAKPAPKAAAKPAAKPAAKATASAPKAKGGSRQSQAESILAGLIRKHPILKGTTVSFGRTRSGAQAEAYYKSGRIVVSPSHRASITTILTHEVWHVIDWRDNHHINWGERIPPRYRVNSRY